MAFDRGSLVPGRSRRSPATPVAGTATATLSPFLVVPTRSVADGRRSDCHVDPAVIVAVVAVWMMQVAADEVVHVAVVRHALVPARRTVNVFVVVCAARMPRRTR